MSSTLIAVYLDSASDRSRGLGWGFESCLSMKAMDSVYTRSDLQSVENRVGCIGKFLRDWSNGWQAASLIVAGSA